MPQPTTKQPPRTDYDDRYERVLLLAGEAVGLLHQLLADISPLMASGLRGTAACVACIEKTHRNANRPCVCTCHRARQFLADEARRLREAA